MNTTSGWPKNLFSESDVEQKVILPLLTGDAWLGVPLTAVRTKQFLPVADIDKGNHKIRHFSPDFVVWERGLPTLVVEAKTVGSNLSEAFREAQLYCQFLNSTLPTKTNPASYIIATNGQRLLAGYWDSLPLIDVSLDELTYGSAARDNLLRLCHYDILSDHARRLSLSLVSAPLRAPISFIGGNARLGVRRDLNSFALPLAPYIRSYFEADDSIYEDEILTRGYVSSD